MSWTERHIHRTETGVVSCCRTPFRRGLRISVVAWLRRLARPGLQEGTAAMITLLGTLIFATVIAIGVLDRNSGLRLLQKYEAPWQVGQRRSPSKPARRRRAHDS
jgi:hypothetical protein